LELAVTVDHEAVEQVSEILSRACEGGVSVEEPFELLDDGLRAQVDSGRAVVVRGYLAATVRSAMELTVQAVQRDLGHLQAFGLRPIGELETRLVQEEDWAEAWKEHFPVQRVGRRIVIQPSWRDYAAGEQDIVIKLDPGMAFGTGLHPTTRLCLIGMEEWSDRDLLGDARVLDVGTGSGVLAMAAAAFGASKVLGIDTDPLAVETATRNVARNGFGAVIDLRAGSLPLAGLQEFHLVVANLIASVHVDLAHPLAATVSSGGRFLAGGIFHDREQEVCAALVATGLKAVARRSDGEWLALEFERR
jgi:ribosomal protein L11 methyltransferase